MRLNLRMPNTEEKRILLERDGYHCRFCGVPVIRERIFGQDYAKTLAIWRNNFRAAWPNLTPSGFDDRFRRLWEYYLAYCEAGFLSGNIDVRQVVFAKPK